MLFLWVPFPHVLLQGVKYECHLYKNAVMFDQWIGFWLDRGLGNLEETIWILAAIIMIIH